MVSAAPRTRAPPHCGSLQRGGGCFVPFFWGGWRSRRLVAHPFLSSSKGVKETVRSTRTAGRRRTCLVPGAMACRHVLAVLAAAVLLAVIEGTSLRAHATTTTTTTATPTPTKTFTIRSHPTCLEDGQCSLVGVRPRHHHCRRRHHPACCLAHYSSTVLHLLFLPSRTVLYSAPRRPTLPWCVHHPFTTAMQLVDHARGCVHACTPVVQEGS